MRKAAPRLVDRDKDGNILIVGLKLSELVAIVGGLVGLGSALWLWLADFAPYQVAFYGPEQVELRCYPEPPKDGKPCPAGSNVSLTAMMLSYINKGNPHKVPVISGETATVTLPRKAVTLHWQWFSNIGDETRGQDAVRLFSVPAEGLAHQTQFLGRIAAEGQARYDDFYLWSDLLADVAAAQGTVKISVSFKSSILDSTEVLTAACDIEIDPQTADIWKDPANDLFQRRFTCKQASPL